jgi:hypothetical protein
LHAEAWTPNAAGKSRPVIGGRVFWLMERSERPVLA